MNVGNSERLDVLQWLDGYSLVVVSMTSNGLKAVVERHRGALPLRVVDSCVLSQYEDFSSLNTNADENPYGDGVMQFDLVLQNATPMIANASKPHADACRAFRPAFKLLRNCALGSLVINEGVDDATVTHSMIRMLQEFLRRVPVKALTLTRVWSYGFDIVDILPMARGLEQLTLVECDVILIINRLLAELSAAGIAYVNVRFEGIFETTSAMIFTFLLENHKVCSTSGRRELHLSNVIVSEGFFKTVIETFLCDKSSMPVVLVVDGNHIVDDTAFDTINTTVDDLRVEEYWAYTRFGFDKCPAPFEVLFNRNRIELYRACPPENSKLINAINVSSY